MTYSNAHDWIGMDVECIATHFGVGREQDICLVLPKDLDGLDVCDETWRKNTPPMLP